MKIYQGLRFSKIQVKVTEDGHTEILDPQRSQNIRNHSPDGFEWGYGGSGPSQLALAILLDALPGNSQPLAERLYQKFKFDMVAKWKAPGWIITQKQIQDWVNGVIMAEEAKT